MPDHRVACADRAQPAGTCRHFRRTSALAGERGSHRRRRGSSRARSVGARAEIEQHHVRIELTKPRSRRTRLRWDGCASARLPWVAAIRRRFGTEVSTSSLPRSSSRSDTKSGAALRHLDTERRMQVRAFQIDVDDDHALAQTGERRRQIGRYERLAYPAFPAADGERACPGLLSLAMLAEPRMRTGGAERRSSSSRSPLSLRPSLPPRPRRGPGRGAPCRNAGSSSIAEAFRASGVGRNVPKPPPLIKKSPLAKAFAFSKHASGVRSAKAERSEPRPAPHRRGRDRRPEAPTSSQSASSRTRARTGEDAARSPSASAWAGPSRTTASPAIRCSTRAAPDGRLVGATRIFHTPDSACAAVMLDTLETRHARLGASVSERRPETSELRARATGPASGPGSRRARRP